MPHFTFMMNNDGTIAQILRDGTLHEEAVTLEQVYAIVTTYFRSAERNIRAMHGLSDRELLRFHGLQAFLMSLTGVEAFTNVFFQVFAEERDRPALLARSEERRGPLIRRLEECLALAFDSPLVDQTLLLARIRELYQLRNQIVHPRSDPASMTMFEEGRIPLVLHGMTQNFQAAFESVEFCHEAYLWCLLLVARVGRAAGNTQIGGFCFYWAGAYGLTERAILDGLGIAPGADLEL
jgi:hypothetical protein